jgi:hypothetical protein
MMMCLDVLGCMYLTRQAVAWVSRAAPRESSFGSLLAEGDSMLAETTLSGRIVRYANLVGMCTLEKQR